MTPAQRAAALRLADDRPTAINDDLYLWATYADALLRELAAEPAQEPVAAIPKGWKFNHAQQSDAAGGVWEIGYLESEDDGFCPIITVDTGLYYKKQDAEPLARAILTRLAADAAPPRRQPLSDEQMRDFVKECGLDWQRGYMPLFAGDDTNRYAVLIRAIEAAHGIGETK